MKIDPIAIPNELAALETVYAMAGHELWLVGGVVRDHILNRPSKDVDLATSATPEEQIAMLDAAGYRWFGTGLSHGTITVLAGDVPYEITTFRTDVETDGRHAIVEFTRNLVNDLSRRDLTMNAMAMSLTDGRLVDPFGGREDALAGRVRFVGTPGDRIREDYLRIMRWFRFMSRFGADLLENTADAVAVAENAHGLKRISVERIWSEMQRILSGGRPAGIVEMMGRLNVLEALDLPAGDIERLAAMRPHSHDPAILLASWLGDAAPAVARRWKMSNLERKTVEFVAARIDAPYDIAAAKLDLVDEVDPKWVDSILRLRQMDSVLRELVTWEIPVLPVAGRDLLEAGMEPGPSVGIAVKAMRAAWISSDYALTREQLLRSVSA